MAKYPWKNDKEWRIFYLISQWLKEETGLTLMDLSLDATKLAKMVEDIKQVIKEKI